MSYVPRLCRKCGLNPIAANGYCFSCDPQPYERDIQRCCEKDSVKSVGCQTERILDDGRRCLVVHRLNLCEEHARMFLGVLGAELEKVA
jgi:hypothetical protein